MMESEHGQLSPERIAHWQAAVKNGRIKLADLQRRSTYPPNPDPDTVALAEHYRLLWHHARILKALSFFVDVTPSEMSAVSGVHPALLSLEVNRVAQRVGVKVETVRHKDRTVRFYRMIEIDDRDEVRAVIQSCWTFDGTFMPQSHEKISA